MINAEAQQRMDRLWDCFSAVHYPDLSVPAIGDAHRESPLTKNGDAVPESYLELFDRPDLVYINTQGKKGKMPEQTSRAFSDCRLVHHEIALGHQALHRRAADVLQGLEDPGARAPRPDVRDDVRLRQGDHHRPRPAGLRAADRAAKSRPTAAHSTICVDDEDQGGAPGTEHVWAATKGVDFVDAECRALQEPGPPQADSLPQIRQGRSRLLARSRLRHRRRRAQV